MATSRPGAPTAAWSRGKCAPAGFATVRRPWRAGITTDRESRPAHAPFNSAENSLADHHLFTVDSTSRRPPSAGSRYSAPQCMIALGLRAIFKPDNKILWVTMRWSFIVPKAARPKCDQCDKTARTKCEFCSRFASSRVGQVACDAHAKDAAFDEAIELFTALPSDTNRLTNCRLS
jgi:hypothetical protein